MSNSLDELSVETLRSMKSQLQKWILCLAIVDAALLLVFVAILMYNRALNVIPLIPLLLLPGLVMTPFLLRLTAVKKEISRREP